MKIKKNKFCNLIYICLCRGMAGLYKLDKEIRSEFDALPHGFRVNLGILPYGTYIGIIRTASGVRIKKGGFSEAELCVNFKTVKACKKVMLARQSVAQSFCRHEIIVGGDIAQAMGLVRIINKTECYLFPRIMTKRILPKIKKEVCTLRVYCKVLFCGNKYKGV